MHLSLSEWYLKKKNLNIFFEKYENFVFDSKTRERKKKHKRKKSED